MAYGSRISLDPGSDNAKYEPFLGQTSPYIFTFWTRIIRGLHAKRCRLSLYTVNLCLVTIKYKNPSCTNITVPQKYVFDFKEYIFPINTFTFHRLEYIS
jgi:hypothetical protein